MSLSSSVHTKEIEGVYYQQNGRIEFRLIPNKLYSTDLIISNLGLSKAANSSRHHKWCGVYGSCVNASLMDGNTILANLNDLGEWSGFKNFTKENQYNNSVSQYYNGGLLANRWNQSDTNQNNTAEQVAGRPTSNFGAVIEEGQIRALQTQVLEANTYKGLLKMRMYFDLLNKLQYIDTSIFKNFRIVIELSNDAQRCLRQRTSDTDLNTTRPFLVAHEVVDEEIVSGMMGKMGNVIYNEMERDQVNIPAVAGLLDTNRYVQQVSNFHISAFNSKTIGRILLWKQPALNFNTRDIRGGANADTVGNGVFSSLALLREVEQVKINGRNILPRSGVEGSNRRLAKMVDSWGDMSIAPFNNGLASIRPNGEPRTSYLQSGNEDIGLMDYVGLEVSEKCSDLQIDLSRSGIFLNSNGAGGAGNNGGSDVGRTANSKYNSSINLVIYAEVKKAIVPSGDSYNVVYV